MNDDYRGYDPDHYHHAGWLSTPELSPLKVLTADHLLQVSSFLDNLDESGAIFTGTVQFDGHSFVVGFNADSEEHFVRIQ